MAENKNACQNFTSNANLCKETVCIDCNRVLDSCRDKDCFEDVKVFLTRFGREIIDRASSVRIHGAKILWTNMSVQPLQFNRGFYQIVVRFFVELCVEACVGMGKSQTFEAVCVVEKTVVLYGSEGNVSIYKSNAIDPLCGGHSSECGFTGHKSSNLPTAVVEVIDPVVLGCKISEDKGRHCCCCCCESEVPDSICNHIGGELCPDGEKHLYVSLGFFSVIRIERPTQYLIQACEYCVPEKECVLSEGDDPCALFAKMSFPTHEFCPPGLKTLSCDCGYEKKCY